MKPVKTAPKKREKGFKTWLCADMAWDIDLNANRMNRSVVFIYGHDMDIRPVARALGMTPSQLLKKLEVAKHNQIMVRFTGTIIEK